MSLLLLPWYVPNDKQNIFEIGWELHQKLKERPEETFCVIAVENNVCQALLIAERRDAHIFIWQARARAGFKYSKLLFNGLIAWTKRKGFNQLKFGTAQKKERFFQKRYGFVPCGNSEMTRYV